MAEPIFIFLGGSVLQEAAFRYARELSVPVVLIDRAKNPHCRPLALEHYQLDGADAENILRTALLLSENHDIVGVYCNNDFGLLSVAALNSLFQLSGPTLDNTTICNNKDVMLSRLGSSGVSIPKGVIFKNGPTNAAAKKPLSDVPFPVIVKPAVGSGSIGITRIESAPRLEKYLAEHKALAAFIIEELIEGTHHDINGLMINGKFHGCGIADRFFGKENYSCQYDIGISSCLAVYGVCPSALSGKDISEAYATVEKAARALGIVNSPVKADLIWSSRGPIILELAPRFHGEIVSAYLIPHSTGQNPIKDWLSYLYSGVYNPSTPISKGCAIWKAILPPGGRTISENAKQRIASIDDIVMMDWRFGKTTGKGSYENNGDVQGLFVTPGCNYDEAISKSERALGLIFKAMNL